MNRNKLEVCFSPAEYDYFHNPKSVVVVVDILRASTAICTAFMNGVKEIIPVGTLEEARQFKEKGFMVAAERDGIVRDFADFGNSPFNFTEERVRNMVIVYSTTNGTQSIQTASAAAEVLIGSYLNISALADYLNRKQHDVVIFCAAWKNKFNLEDSVFAGALAELLLAGNSFYTICDSAKASLDLWSLARHNPYGYILKSAQKDRLAKNGLDDVIEFCHEMNLSSKIPVLRNNSLVCIE